MKFTIEQIAEVAHETNRAYCRLLGDTSHKPWKDAPDWQKQSAINGAALHMESHSRGCVPSPSTSHEMWMQEKCKTGWTYGPVKDAEKKEHPSLVHYSQLPHEERIKDYLFGAVCAAFAQVEYGRGI
jgi:hypothetical protein